MAYELYTTLEVQPAATPEEIRRAYYQMVRKYPPEKDPARFERLRRAYETLSDENARRDYDALQEYGDEITGLFSESIRLMEQGHWESAAAQLKHVLVLSPGNQTALNSLGMCFLHAHKFEKANEVYRDLVQDHPEVALYQFSLGISYFELAELARSGQTGKVGYGTHDDLYVMARKHFVKAVELQPHNPDHYIAVARTFVEQGDFDQGLQWAEKATSARGTTDYHDFEALFWICLFQLRRGDLIALERTVERIAGLLPDDADLRRFAAYRFARVGIELYEGKSIEPAVTFLRLACRFDPTNDDLRQMLQGASQTLETCRSFDRMMQDDAVIHPLKRLAAVCMAMYFEEPIDNLERVLDEIFQELDTYTMQEVLESLRRLRSEYPLLIEINQRMFGDMERAAAEHVAAHSARMMSSLANAPSEASSAATFFPRMVEGFFAWLTRIFSGR